MQISDAQKQAAQIIELYGKNFGLDANADWCLLKLQEELGELVSAYLKSKGRTRAKDSSLEATRQNLKEELADVLGFTLALAAKEGIDSNAALQEKWFHYLKDESAA